MRSAKQFKYIQVAALVITAIIYLGIKNFPFTRPAVVTEKKEFYYVARVVDGDTIKLSNNERIRLIGVDTPELHYSDKLLRDSKRSGKDIKTIQSLGAKASKFTKDLCLNKKVRLEYDVEKHDRYGRLLAYVYLEDGTFINAKIVEEGFAQVMTVVPNVKHADLFLKLQKEAREANRGLWKT